MASARLIVTLVGFLAISATAQPSSRIMGGNEASKTAFPHACSVRLDGAHNCGGSIIGTRSILTAAHCVVENDITVDAKRLAVRVGSTNQFSGGKLYYISDITVHPNYDDVKNDIAVLTLETPLQFTDRIAMIEIATSSNDVPAAGASATVAGWGEQASEVSSHKLHSMKFTIATKEDCTNAIGEMDDSNICLAHALKKGSCLGDAGNGAINNKKILFGVSSYIVGACGSRYPDVFINVAHYASWIQKAIV